jgi:hypothetical protein
VGIDGGLDQFALDAAGRHVGQVQLDREQAPRGEERDPIAVGTEGRRQVELHLVPLGGDAAAVLIGRPGRLLEWGVRGSDRFLPLAGEGVELVP